MKDVMDIHTNFLMKVESQDKVMSVHNITWMEYKLFITKMLINLVKT